MRIVSTEKFYKTPLLRSIIVCVDLTHLRTTVSATSSSFQDVNRFMNKGPPYSPPQGAVLAFP